MWEANALRISAIHSEVLWQQNLELWSYSIFN